MKSDTQNIYLLRPFFSGYHLSGGRSPSREIIFIICCLFPLSTVSFPGEALAQPIIPARDGTNTIAIPQGNQINITGGQLSRDGANLFHSLEKFGLDRYQVANFLAQPHLRNILTRVVGGEASVINGLIKVSGGNPHLFIMNPSGILFGDHARLDVPGSFLATTATGIGFEDQWFSAVGHNDYRTLVGNPNSFAFASQPSGIIMNAGHLETPTRENLMLVAGSTVNAGTLKSPGGNIKIVAVPGEKLVRLSQEGHLLSLEIHPLSGSTVNNLQPWTLPIASLPKLIAGGTLSHATKAMVNKKGQIVLSGSGNNIVSGTIDANAGLEGNGGNVIIYGAENTHFSGEIIARGGRHSGNGGTVKISGGGTFSGTVDLSAGKGSLGTLQLASENIRVVGDHLTGEGKTSHLNLDLDRSLQQLIIPETALENLPENAKVIFQATDDIAIEDLSDTRLHFHSDNGWITLVADADENGIGSVSLADLEEATYREGTEIKKSDVPLTVGNQQNSRGRILEKISEVDRLLPLEISRSQNLGNQLGIDIEVEQLRKQSIQDSLFAIARQIGKRPALIYVTSQAESLDLILVTPYGSPIFKSIRSADRQALQHQVKTLIRGVTNPPNSERPEDYQTAAKQLYDWIIAPIESDLQSRGIDMLLFSLDPGMRSLPLAALYDGNQFLIQNYSLSLIPSIYLTDTNYQNLRDSTILAMGASHFRDPNLVPLPAIPQELQAIAQNWRVKTFLNREFTFDNLKAQRTSGQFPIVHLATHGQFDLETPNNSYIQLWDNKLQVERLRQLAKTGHPIELLVLSACETAFGKEDAELGLAGLAVSSGVKTVLASLWQVEDRATLGLMSEFYRQLSQQSQTIKAEALRQAQIAAIEGNLGVTGNNSRRSERDRERFSSDQNSEKLEKRNLSHPYYWGSFIMIGSPW